MFFFNFVYFMDRAIHEVKYPRICPSSSNDEISAPQNRKLSQYLIRRVILVVSNGKEHMYTGNTILNQRLHNNLQHV